MTKRIGHLGILVSDIEKVAKKLSSLFGLEEPKIRDDTTRRMKVAVIKFENVDIELLEDYSEDGLFSRACRDRGNFIHHFAVVSEEIESDVAELRKKGFLFSAQEPIVGLRGKKIIFLSPKDVCGINIELTEP